jgi:LysM repeat protein
MNMANPFQIPACLKRADLKLIRRNRFRKGVIAVVAASAALLVGLLIAGCMSEHSKTASITPLENEPDFSKSQANQVLVAEQKPESSPAPAALQPVLPVAKKIVLAHSGEFYMVKGGDTLARIAKTHGTTINAIKAANSLDGDRIAVGAKLKIPTA